MKKIRSGEITTCIFETFKRSVMLYSFHIYQTASGTAMDTMCTCQPYQSELPHWKCVLRCCANFPYIAIPSKKPDKHQ